MRRKVNPAVAFVLGIAAVIVLMVAGVAIFGNDAGRGEPPFPGATWSTAHGHWH